MTNATEIYTNRVNDAVSLETSRDDNGTTSQHLLKASDDVISILEILFVSLHYVVWEWDILCELLPSSKLAGHLH